MSFMENNLLQERVREFVASCHRGASATTHGISRVATYVSPMSRVPLPAPLRALVRRLRPRPAFTAPLDVPGRVYAVGDIHGRADLLERMLDRIEEDAATREEADTALVFLGDYVDRGDESAAVVARVRALASADPERVIALMGNHERMMLDFLADPIRDGRRWLRYGGLQTLASYGIGGVSETASPTVLQQASEALTAAMPEGELTWLSERPTLWRRGNLVCVHAALDPHASVEDQAPQTLIWGHPDFWTVPRCDGVWVAHGHTVVDEPRVEAGRVALDTGAWFSERLTAGVFAGSKVETLEG